MELAKEKKTVVFESADADKMWVFRSDGTTSLLDLRNAQPRPSELADPRTVYLFDSAGEKPREPLRVNAYTVVASSPNPANYKQFLKRVGSRLFLPCWSLDDLKCVREFFPHITEDILQDRYRLFGGIPRRVLPTLENLAEGYSEEALEKPSMLSP